MNVAPILATSLGIIIFRAVLDPLLDRYRRWRCGPRIAVARRDWRGRYVPDLLLIRMERTAIGGMAGLFVLGLAIGWTIMVPHR